MMKYRRRIFVGMAYFGLMFTSVFAVDLPDGLMIQRLEHQLELQTARELVATAFDEALERAVTAKDSAKSLKFLEGKKRFQRENLLPSDAALNEAVVAYSERRRAADEKLLTEWKRMILEAETAADKELVANLKKELEAFVKDQGGQISAGQAKLQQANSLEARSRKICESLSKVITGHDEIVATLSKNKSSLNPPKVGPLLDEEANKILKGQTWGVTCRIVSIKRAFGQNGRYQLEIEPPVEIETVASEWRASPVWTVALTQEKAEKVRKGDWLEISGTPRFELDSGGFFTRIFQSKLASQVYTGIYLHNSRSTIRHQ